MEPLNRGSFAPPASRYRVDLLQALEENGVHYVLLAHREAPARSAAGERLHVRICFQQSWENCSSLSRALEELEARAVSPAALLPPWSGPLRMAPTPLWFATRWGCLVALPEVPGRGGYEELLSEARATDVHGLSSPVLWIPSSAEARSRTVPEQSEAK